MRGWGTRALVLLGVALTVPGAASARDRGVVEYRLSPVIEHGAITALAVTMRLAGDSSGTTRIGWPDSWAGERRLAAPVVRPDWFQVVGEALFARPDGGGERPSRFRWIGPRSIGFASDLQHDHGRTTVDGITESIVVGGRDLHVVKTGRPGHEIRVARVGRYAFDGTTFDSLAVKVIEAERAFWADRHREPFLVTLTPVTSRPGAESYGGNAFGGAFALQVDGSVPLDRLAWQLGHEYFHTWNDARLGDSLPEPYERGYWFSEGFTDFYASRLMLRAGLISPEQFAGYWNEKLRTYALSLFRRATNDQVAATFWSDPQAKGMPYQRGALLAAIWDRQLLGAGVGGGLDAVLRRQKATLPTLKDKPTAIDLFARSMRNAGVDVRPDLDRYIEHGEPLLLPADAFGPCARVTTEERPAFARGWDAKATAAAGNVVTGLDPASPAHAAGLRDGMRIVQRIAGKAGDPTVDYIMRVSDGSTERLIRFRPVGRGTTTIQQLVLDPAAFAAPEACRRSLAG